MPGDRSDHEDLDRRLRDGDVAALADSFERHRDRLWRIVDFRIDPRLSGRVDPDDVLQESYLAAQSRMHHYATLSDSDGSPITPFLWLRMIVVQTLIDVHRQHLGAKMRDAGREVSLQTRRYPQATTASLASHLFAGLTSPSGAAARAEMAAQLEEAIAGMEELDREVLALRHFEELSNSEVAAVLGIQQKAASIRYVRAIRRLRDIVSRLPGFQGWDGDV